MPVCKDANERSGVAAHHAMLMGTKSDMDDVAKAVAKVVENLDDLRGWRPTKNVRKYRALAT